MMACHKSEEESSVVCQGWLRALKLDAIGVRIALLEGRVALEEMEDQDVPPLFSSFAELFDAKGLKKPPRNKNKEDTQ